ncbi:MAG TPA: hypothetical protein VHX49_06060 [Candidatus Acidoferrales bacterium]|jgi:hypothetical protein|nr:hypothetical protein [Candidatus Acidoferrales bacterium]
MRKSPKRRGARSRGSPVRRSDVERDLLRQLCHARLTRAAWAKIQRGLRAYAWQDVEHGLVYAAIQRLGGVREPQLLREQLPAEATRMGFPDIDWRIYFVSTRTQATPPDIAEIAALIGRLPMSRAAKTNP